MSDHCRTHFHGHLNLRGYEVLKLLKIQELEITVQNFMKLHIEWSTRNLLALR